MVMGNGNAINLSVLGGEYGVYIHALPFFSFF